MKQFIKNIFIASSFFVSSVFPSLVLGDRENPEMLSPEEQAAVQEMNAAVNSATKPDAEKVINDLIGANVFPDSKEPDKFKAKTILELEKVKFDTSRLMVSMKKWGQIKIILKARNLDNSDGWAEKCQVKLYVGFNGCLPSGKMLLFKGSCTCVALETNKEQSVLFFLPGDIRKRFGFGRIPDYCAIHFTVDGINQDIVIVGSDGKNAYHTAAEKFHKETKQRSEIESYIMRNVDQIPVYADVSVGDHPSLLLEIDT